MSLTPVILVQWWFVLHLVGSAWDPERVSATRLPRIAHGFPHNQAEGSLPPDGDVGLQPPSLHESSGTPLRGSSDVEGRPRVRLWRRWSFQRDLQPQQEKASDFAGQPLGRQVHGTGRETSGSGRTVSCSSCFVEIAPGAGRSRGQVQTEEALSSQLPPTEALGDDSSAVLSTAGALGLSQSGAGAGGQALSTEGAVSGRREQTRPTRRGLAGGRDQDRWIDVEFPSLRKAMSTISLSARQMIAGLVRQSAATAPALTREEAGFISSFEQDFLRGPFVLAPYARGTLSLLVRRGALLGVGGNAFVYKAVEQGTERELALKIPWFESESLAPGIATERRDSRAARQAQQIAQTIVDSIVTIRKAFAKGGSAEQLLTEDFITVPLAPPARVRGLPDVFELNGWVVFNVIAIFDIAKCTVLQLVNRRWLSRRMRDNLSREMIIGLAKIHAYGMLHRDVKPENMLVSSKGQLSYTDFDSSLPARTSDGWPSFINCSVTLPGGTELYLAPELAECGITRRTLRVTPAGDAWALGMSLYLLWCDRDIYSNRAPYDRRLEFISNIRRKEQLRLSFRGCHSIPPALSLLIEGFLEPAADKRLTPLEAVETSPFFSSAFRAALPASRREGATHPSS